MNSSSGSCPVQMLHTVGPAFEQATRWQNILFAEYNRKKIIHASVTFAGLEVIVAPLLRVPVLVLVQGVLFASVRASGVKVVHNHFSQHGHDVVVEGVKGVGYFPGEQEYRVYVGFVGGRLRIVPVAVILEHRFTLRDTNKADCVRYAQNSANNLSQLNKIYAYPDAGSIGPEVTIVAFLRHTRWHVTGQCSEILVHLAHHALDLRQ